MKRSYVLAPEPPMLSFVTSCFGSGRTSDPQQTTGTPGDRPIDAVNPAKCIFCNVSKDKFDIVLQDDDYVCFTDRSPAAAVHLLVVPRVHIANVQSLKAADASLVRNMHAFGSRAMDMLDKASSTMIKPADKVTQTERRFGFHIPPFRSVDHLHLHCLQLPFRSSLKALKYRVAQSASKEYSKGWSWFAEWQQTCAILEQGRQVKVSPC